MEPRTLEEQLEDALNEVERLQKQLEAKREYEDNYAMGYNVAKELTPVIKGMTDNGLSREEAFQLCLSMCMHTLH